MQEIWRATKNTECSCQSSQKEKELQWWLGTILDIQKDSFTASLEDLDGRESMVEFSKSIIQSNHIDRLSPNSRFTFSIRCRVSPYTGDTEYLSKFNIYSKMNWHSKYEKHVQKVIDDILPDDLLNL